MMDVQFVDLAAQYQTIRSEIQGAIDAVIGRTAFAGGPFVEEFEGAFAAAHGVQYCAAVNSGTSALHVALWALGVGPGDEVIVPTNTFFATPEAVSLCGATPIFVDCEEDYYNLSPSLIEQAITPKTKGIIAVHLYGQPADVGKIKPIAERHGLFLVEDCAQAHLAEVGGQKVGSFGNVGCFSFYPGKNLGAYGEGGAVLTDDRALYARVLGLRDHGSTVKYHHEEVGHNYRMDGLQGAILNVKLKHLEEWTERRRVVARQYREWLDGVGDLVLPAEMATARHVYHLFVVRTGSRDELMAFLGSRGVRTGIHYPIPCHRQRAYESHPQYETHFEVADAVADELVSLPMHADLDETHVRYVCDQIEEFFGGKTDGR